MTGQETWTVLSLRVTPPAVEQAAELLQEVTGNGVTIEPPIEALGPDEGYVLDEHAPYTLRAYLKGEVPRARRERLRRLVDDRLGSSLDGRLSWETIREEDWAEAWKAHYEVEKVGRVAVRPAWREYEPGPDEVVVSLDPGMAFGTGQHPTTRMCLMALQERPCSGRVLDLGCGSGVLAIAALRLGADSVLAVDIEEQAVAATRSNAELNGLSGGIIARLGSTEVVEEDSRFACIMANINAAAVKSLAGAMAGLLETGGWLAAGGVIAEREAEVKAALEAAGLSIERVISDGDWRTFIARRSP